MPWLIALRVVSLPATTRRMKNDANSALVSRSPSTSACMSTLVMSSRGDAVRSSPSAWAYCESSIAADISTSMVVPYSGSPMPRMTFESSNMRRLSASGMPIMSQMIFSGSVAAISCTKSQAPAGATSATMRRAWARTFSSSAATMRGVKPRFTSLRSLVCRGASMLIMDPKNSSSSIGEIPDVGAATRDEAVGVARRPHHVVVAHEGPEAGTLREVDELGLLVKRHRALGTQLREQALAVVARPDLR